MSLMSKNAADIRDQLRNWPDKKVFKKTREKLLEIALQLEVAEDRIARLEEQIEILEKMVD